MALRDDEGSAQVGQISGSAARNPTQRSAPAIPRAPVRVPGPQNSLAEYAEVYEGRQRRGLARMRGG